MPTLSQTIATLDRRCHEGEVRKWISGDDADTLHERLLDGRARATVAASRARGYRLVAEQRRQIEEDRRRCR